MVFVMTNLDELRAFVSAEDSGSFSAAARNLGKAQSAVSTAIANLEIDLDLKLFDRTGYRPVLTEAGVSVLNYAKTVLESLDALQRQAETLNASVEPSFAFYIEDGLMVERVGSLLIALSERFPSLELKVEQRGREPVLHALRDGAADVALITTTEEVGNDFRQRGIGFQRLVPVCHSKHPLARKKEVSRSELARYRQIIGPSDRDSTARSCVVSPKVWISGSLETRMVLVLEGLGWSELPVDLVQAYVLQGRLCVLDYAFAQNAILNTVGILTSNTAASGPVMDWLVDQFAAWDQRAWIGDHRVGRR